MRIDGRQNSELRPIIITRKYTKYAEGSVLIEYGDTKVLCNVSISNKVPKFLLDKNSGWITAEYSMLPRSTHSRMNRDSVVGKVNARAQEISRLIGRCLRACVNLTACGSRQFIVDCEVLQADGGTRTASITGGFIALYDALNSLVMKQELSHIPITNFIAAVSVGMYNGEALLDLNYVEDSNCDSDINCVMLDNQEFVEIQGNAERKSINRQNLDQLLELAQVGIQQIITLQKQIIQI